MDKSKLNVELKNDSNLVRKSKPSIDFKRDSDSVQYGLFSDYIGCGVYSIKCIDNEKQYIGASKDIKSRLIKHFSELRFNRHTNQTLQDDYNKYGFTGFSFEILCITEDLLVKEKEYQSSIPINNLYNDKITGVYITDKLRLARASANKDSHRTQEYRDTLSLIKSQRVIQFNLKGEFIKDYDSVKIVTDLYPKMKPQPIRGACNGSKKTAYGYIWQWERNFLRNEDIV